MRTLSAEHIAALDATTTLPGVLVELGTDPVIRLASRGDVTALSNDFVGWFVTISGLGMTQRAGQTGALQIGDHDQSMSAALLNAEVGFPIKVWRYDRAALEEDSNDAPLIFDGIAGPISGGPAERMIVIPLLTRETTTLFSPRRRMTAEHGFGTLPAAGKIYTVNGQNYKLEPEE
jgi:hypothetical protein